MDRLKSSVTCLTSRRSKALSSFSAAACNRSSPGGGGGVDRGDLDFTVEAASRLAEKDIWNRDINGLRGDIEEEDTGRWCVPIVVIFNGVDTVGVEADVVRTGDRRILSCPAAASATTAASSAFAAASFFSSSFSLSEEESSSSGDRDVLACRQQQQQNNSVNIFSCQLAYNLLCSSFLVQAPGGNPSK